jgi:hypothetical protein
MSKITFKETKNTIIIFIIKPTPKARIASNQKERKTKKQ